MQSCFHSHLFYPILRSIFSAALVAGFLSGVLQVFALAGEDDSLHWYFEGQRQMRDGGVEAHFSLQGTDSLKIEELEFFYTMGSSARGKSKSPGVQSERRAAAYYKNVPPDTRNIIIYSGRYAQLQLWAVAKAGGMTHVAQIEVNLYGQSGLDKTDFEELDAFTALAGLDVIMRGPYGVMTGEQINFSMRNGYSGQVRLYLDGKKIAELQPVGGVYSYLLPGGRKLPEGVNPSYNELLFITDIFDAEGVVGGIRFTCWLPLYRSARDNQDIPGGLATLFSAAALSLIAVFLKGRRFTWR